jgi:predicted HicB family RNase H-like nuclease
MSQFSKNDGGREMDNFDASAYNISVVRRLIDGHPYFVGTVREFPHIRVYEDTWAESYQAIQAILEDLFAESLELNEPFPAPLHEDTEFSGRVTTRLPKWLHARLDSQAKNEGVSLNSHIVTLLTIASTNRAFARSSVESQASEVSRPLKSSAVKGFFAKAHQTVSLNQDRLVRIQVVQPMVVFSQEKHGSLHEEPRSNITTYKQELNYGPNVRH